MRLNIRISTADLGISAVRSLYDERCTQRNRLRWPYARGDAR